VRSADQRDKNFGDAVADVSAHFGFHDKQVLLNGFCSTSGDNWCSFLSSLRGAVIHEGGFDVVRGSHDAREIVRVSDHLHDLLIRIFLKSLDAVAQYSSPIVPVGMPRQLEWVKATAAPSELIFPN
jgi:hypothetical protein